jgi:formylmethanofuran dehydrogenase subunit E
MSPKGKAKAAPQVVCNLCGEPKTTARRRMQYPSFACNQCYRAWKRGLLLR